MKKQNTLRLKATKRSALKFKGDILDLEGFEQQSLFSKVSRFILSYLLIFCLISQNYLWAVQDLHVVEETLYGPRVQSYTASHFEEASQIGIVDPLMLHEGDVHNAFADFNIFKGSGALFKSPAGTKTLYNRVHSQKPINIDGGTLQTEHPVSLIMSNTGGIVFNKASCKGASHLSLFGGEILKTNHGIGCSVTTGAVSVLGSIIAPEEIQSLSFTGRDVQILNSILMPKDNITIQVGPKLHLLDQPPEQQQLLDQEDFQRHYGPESLRDPLKSGFLLDVASALTSKKIHIESFEKGMPLHINGSLQSTEEDIVIHGKGDVYLNHVTSFQKIKIKTTGCVYLGNHVIAGAGIEIDAEEGVILSESAILKSTRGPLSFSHARGNIINEGKLISGGDITFASGVSNEGLIATDGLLKGEKTFTNALKARVIAASLSPSTVTSLFARNSGSIDITKNLALNVDDLTLKGHISTQGILKVSGKNLILSPKATLTAHQGCDFQKGFGTLTNEGLFSAFGKGVTGTLKALNNKGKIDLSQAQFHAGSLKNHKNSFIRTHTHFTHTGDFVKNWGTIFTLGLHQSTLTGSYTDSGTFYTPTLLLLNAGSVKYTNQHQSYMRSGVINASESFFAQKDVNFFFRDIDSRSCVFQVNTQGNDLTFNGQIRQNSSPINIQSQKTNELSYFDFFWEGEKKQDSRDFKKRISSLVPSTLPSNSPIKRLLNHRASGVYFQSGCDIKAEKFQVTPESGSLFFNAKGRVVLKDAYLRSGGFKTNNIHINSGSAVLNQSQLISLFGSISVTAKDLLTLTHSSLISHSSTEARANHLVLDNASLTSTHGDAQAIGISRTDINDSRIKGKLSASIEGGAVSVAHSWILSAFGTASIQGTQDVHIHHSHMAGTETELRSDATLDSSCNTIEAAYNRFIAENITSSGDHLKGESSFKATESISLKDTYNEGNLSATAPKIGISGTTKVTGNATFSGETIHNRSQTDAGGSATFVATKEYNDAKDTVTQAGKNAAVIAPENRGFKGKFKAGETFSADMKDLGPEQKLSEFLDQIDAPTIEARLREADIVVDDDLVIQNTLHLWAQSFQNKAKITADHDFMLNLQGQMINQGLMEIREKASISADSVLNMRTIDAESLEIKARHFSMEQAVNRHKTANGFYETLGPEAALKARSGDLKVETTEMLTSKGGLFKAKGSVILNSKGYLYLGPQILRSETSVSDKNFSYHCRTLKNKKVSVEASEDIILNSGKSMLLEGVDLQAQNDINLRSESDIRIRAVYDEIEEAYSRTTKGGHFGKKKTVSTQRSSETALVNPFNAGGNTVVHSSHGDIDLQNVYSKSGKKTHIEATEGSVRFPIAQSTQRSSTQKSSRSLVWQQQSSYGNFDQTFSHDKFESLEGVDIVAGKDIQVQHAQDLDALQNQPGMAWIKDLRQNSKATFSRVYDVHEEWHQKSQGLTGPAAAIISMAIAIATQGVGTMIMPGITAGTTAAAMANAGFTALASQASVFLINNQGNLGKTFKDLGSSQNVRSLVASVLTSGITDKLSSSLNLPSAPKGVFQHLQKNALRAGVSAGMSVAVQGQDFQEALLGFVTSTAANTVGGVAANTIGAAYGDNQIDYLTHKLAHGFAGAMVGGILGSANGTAGDSAIAGAIGGILSEVIADTQKEQIQNRVQDRVNEMEGQGAFITDTQRRTIVLEESQAVLDFAPFATALSAFVLNKDTDIAAHTATNALENNFVLAIEAGVLGGKILVEEDQESPDGLKKRLKPGKREKSLSPERLTDTPYEESTAWVKDKVESSYEAKDRYHETGDLKDLLHSTGAYGIDGIIWVNKGLDKITFGSWTKVGEVLDDVALAMGTGTRRITRWTTGDQRFGQESGEFVYAVLSVFGGKGVKGVSSLGKVRVIKAARAGEVLSNKPLNVKAASADKGASRHVPPTGHQYFKAPQTLKAFPDAIEAKMKSSVQGGGKKRDRWKDHKGKIYQWDSRHGTVEMHGKRGKHLGEFDPKTGTQLKGPDSRKNLKSSEL